MNFYLTLLILSDFAIYGIVLGIIVLTIVVIYLLVRGIKRDIGASISNSDEYFSSVKGLKSRGQLIDELNNYIDTHPNPELTLIYADIDNFKGINDAFGQRQGDIVLTTIAKNLVKILPRYASIANFAGDDFVIFIRGDYSYERIESFIAEVQNVISDPIKIFEDEVKLSASIGIVQAPYNGRHSNVLLSNLEVAMYVSKREGKNRYTFFDAELSDKEADNASYYKQVKKAIARNEFTLYYQPIIDLNSGEIVGLESLVRWNHPEMGLIQPGKFLNILEQTGDINWIGIWGFETIIKFSIEWRKTFPKSQLVFSFNLSPKQLMSPTIVDDFRLLLKKYKEEASNYCLEIIEFALFERYGQIKNNLFDLKSLGFKIAIDDFGLDYSTLNRLEQLSVDVIKLNRTFAKNTKESYLSEKVTEMLAQYADKENKMVVVEGLENLETVNYFANLGIKLGQGYYFSEPKPSRLVVDDYKNGVYVRKLQSNS